MILNGYRPARWRNTTGADATRRAIGVGFNLDGGEVAALLLDWQSARQLAESLAAALYLTDERVPVAPFTETDVLAIAKAVESGNVEEAKHIVESKGATWHDGWERRSQFQPGDIRVTAPGNQSSREADSPPPIA